MKYFIYSFAVLMISAYFWGDNFAGAATETSLTNQSPIVVELYTSQSCSSCPPADKILAEIGENPNIISLACHVTYWNHLSWKDTLSNEECTNRQREFNAHIGNNRVYTPQMVVNGTTEFVGSKRNIAIAAIERPSHILKLEINEAQRVLSVVVPKLNNTKSLYIEWIGFNNYHKQDIKSGENRGKFISYSHPVRSIAYDTLKPNQATINYVLPDMSLDNIAVMIREEKAGKVIAAGQIKL